MTTTMELVVTQLQSYLHSELKLLHDPDLQKQYRQSTILPQPQVRKDTPGLIDVNGLGRPKEFCSKEEDFQQWSKKTEAFFWSDQRIRQDVGVVCWTDDGNHDRIHQSRIPADCDEPGARSTKLGVCAAGDAYSAYGSRELRGE